MAYQLVTIGTSLGGFEALRTVLGALSEDFPLPIVVVQHRSNEDSEDLAPLLAAYVKLPIIEVEDKEEARGGHIYVCPSNYHLLAERGYFALSTDPPVSYARPSIDVLFESAADSYGEGVIGVLLTGMGRDGAEGLLKIKKCGGFALVQDPTSAEGQAMPASAIASVAVDKVLPLPEIAPFLIDLCAGVRTNK